MDELMIPTNATDLPEEGKVGECYFSKHQWLVTKFILTSICGTCVALFGIIGNITTAAVLSRPMMRTPNNLYLTALAVFDTLVLLLAVMLYSTEYIQEYFDSVTLYVLWMDSTPYLYTLSNFAQTGSVYITVSVTFERYLVVVHPKISQSYCTKPRAKAVILCVICFSALFNASKFFEVQVVRHENCTGFASRSLGPSELLMDPIYATVYTLWLSQFTMVFFPFAVLLTMNTAIVWNFKKSLKMLDCKVVDIDRGILKEQSRDATRVLVTIVVVFLICNCWGFVITVLESVYSGRQLSQWAPEFYAFSREAINFLAIVNSSINFLICLTFSDDFRCELLILYGCKRRRRPSIRHMAGHRRKAFSAEGSNRRKSRPSIAHVGRPSRGSISFGGLHKMRYVDRLYSAETLANYSSSASVSGGASSNSLKVPSFSALIEAAQMFINGTTTLNVQKDSRRNESPIKEIETFAQQRKSLSNGHVSNLHTNGTIHEEFSTQQPFLYRNTFFSDFEMEWETMI